MRCYELEVLKYMDYRREFRDINGHLIGFSESNHLGGEDYFDMNSQRLGYTDGQNTYNNASQLLVQGAAGPFLFGRRAGR